nr:hypothetical protein [Nitratireductor mangrovi]
MHDHLIPIGGQEREAIAIDRKAEIVVVHQGGNERDVGKGQAIADQERPATHRFEISEDAGEDLVQDAADFRVVGFLSAAGRLQYLLEEQAVDDVAKNRSAGVALEPEAAGAIARPICSSVSPSSLSARMALRRGNWRTL